MSGYNHKDKWLVTPMERIIQQFGVDFWNAIYDEKNVKKFTKSSASKSSSKTEKFEWYFKLEHKQKIYQAGGNSENGAINAVCEQFLRDRAESSGFDLPKTRYSCQMIDPTMKWDQFRAKHKWRSLETLKKDHGPGATPHYTTDSGHNYFILKIRSPPWKTDALKEYFTNKQYRFYKTQGEKEKHFKERCYEDFLNDYEDYKIQHSDEKRERMIKMQNEARESEIELEIEENLTFLGIKNRQNRFVQVRSSDFADYTTYEKWSKYFDRIQREEMFTVTEKSINEDKYWKCTITTDTKPGLAVAAKGIDSGHARCEAIKLLVYHIQISCGQI